MSKFWSDIIDEAIPNKPKKSIYERIREIAYAEMDHFDIGVFLHKHYMKEYERLLMQECERIMYGGVAHESIENPCMETPLAPSSPRVIFDIEYDYR